MLYDQFPEYQCHKLVHAFKITEVTPRIGDVLLFSSEFPNDPVSVTIPWYIKFKPEMGQYFVAYEDGYTSISPAVAFESGYSLVLSVDLSVALPNNEANENSAIPVETPIDPV